MFSSFFRRKPKQPVAQTRASTPASSVSRLSAQPAVRRAGVDRYDSAPTDNMLTGVLVASALSDGSRERERQRYDDDTPSRSSSSCSSSGYGSYSSGGYDSGSSSCDSGSSSSSCD